MKKLQLILAFSCSIIGGINARIGDTNASEPYLNRENKNLVKKLAIGCGVLGTGFMAAGTIDVAELMRTQNGKKLAPGLYAKKLACRSFIGMVVGFGVPLAVQKYQQSKSFAIDFTPKQS